MFRDNTVNDQVRIAAAPKILPEEWIFLPDFINKGLLVFSEGMGRSGDANLIVALRKIAELYVRVGSNLGSLVIPLEVGHIDRKSVHSHR